MRPVSNRYALPLIACLATTWTGAMEETNAEDGIAPCRLVTIPQGPASRGVHTMLLADFDPQENNDATYARVHRADIGLGTQADAPGKFGGGVAIADQGGDVRFAGLDNYNPLHGTASFWVRSRDEPHPIWNDGQEHWLLVLYPERAAASPRHGMAPYFLAVRKTAENMLELKIVQQNIPHYAIAYCDALLSDIENALAALGDLDRHRIPRYARGGEHNWVYAEPARNYFAVGDLKGAKTP